jgi:hypothetical protein
LLLQSVERAAAGWPGDGELVVACLDRSLEALAHVDRNAHQATLAECWLDDLGRTVETGQPAASFGD